MNQVREIDGVCFLHGNVGHPNDWNQVIKAIQLNKPELVCHTVNLWADLAKCSFDVAADDINRIPENIKFRSPLLVGYSLGGRLAGYAITKRETPWAALALVSTHPGINSQQIRNDRIQSDLEWAKLIDTHNWPEFLKKWNAQPVLKGQKAGEQQLLLAQYSEQIAIGFQNWSIGSQADFRIFFDDVQIPIKWFAGEHDEKFRKLIDEAAHSEAEVSIIQGSGHRILIEQPQSLADAIIEFIDKL